LKILLDAVERVSETVAAAADEAEAIKTLPKATVDAVYDSGLLRLKLPEIFGGEEADPVTQTKVIEALSYVDASAGWCLMIGASSIAIPAAFLSNEGVAEVFTRGRVPRASTAFMPTGTALPQEGGYLLNGRWAFASGVRHAEWINLGALVADDSGDGPPQHRMFTLPTSKARIHDNWNVIGLQGTGSCDVSVENLFVPASLSYDLLHDDPKRGGPLYRLGIPAFFANEHAAFAFGVARRALDTIVAMSKERMRGIPPTRLVERGTFQKAVGECDLKLRAARALVMELNERAWETVVAGSTPALQLQTALRSSGAYATDIAVHIITQAYHYAGGSAVYASHILQRCLRDIHTATQHLMVSDSAYEQHGKLVLGLPDVHPLG
jgi:alkylation response protein AidB-like acyl-CoA dehydrogenase